MGTLNCFLNLFIKVCPTLEIFVGYSEVHCNKENFTFNFFKYFTISLISLRSDKPVLKIIGFFEINEIF